MNTLSNLSCALLVIPWEHMHVLWIIAESLATISLCGNCIASTSFSSFTPWNSSNYHQHKHHYRGAYWHPGSHASLLHWLSSSQSIGEYWHPEFGVHQSSVQTLLITRDGSEDTPCDEEQKSVVQGLRHHTLSPNTIITYCYDNLGLGLAASNQLVHTSR